MISALLLPRFSQLEVVVTGGGELGQESLQAVHNAVQLGSQGETADFIHQATAEERNTLLLEGMRPGSAWFFGKVDRMHLVANFCLELLDRGKGCDATDPILWRQVWGALLSMLSFRKQKRNTSSELAARAGPPISLPEY